MRKTVAILGIPIDDLDSAQALQRLEQFVESGRFHQVATANTDFLIKAHADPELKSILLAADMVVPDGMPIVLASRWLRAGLRERVAGADLVPGLAGLAAKRGWRLYMLGARPEVAQAARRRLEEDCPGLQIVGCLSPPVASILEMDNEAILADVERTAPHVLLVAFGNPKQEKWIHMHRGRLRVPVCMGVGGTFDFLAGAAPRAPLWMQRAGLEWLHRLANDPRRLWRRYATDLVHFARFLAVQLWSLRGWGTGEEARIAHVRAGDATVISVSGFLGVQALGELQLAAEKALEAPTHIVLDLHAATGVDSSVLGTLLNLPKRARHVGREVRLAGASRRVIRALRTACADDLLRVAPTFTDALTAAPESAFDVRALVNGTAAVLQLCGRAAGERWQEVEAAAAAIPPSIRALCLDLRSVGYVDSGMLAALARLEAGQRSRSCAVTLAPSPEVRRALLREGAAHLFTLVDSPCHPVPVSDEAADSVAVPEVAAHEA